jgi:hypothetical protein
MRGLVTADAEGDMSTVEEQIERLGHRARKADPLHVPDAPDRSMYLEGAFERIHQALSDREDLLGYFGCLMKGLKRRDIASDLGVSVDRVDELRKQFSSRTGTIYKELFGEETQKKNREARASRS